MPCINEEPGEQPRSTADLQHESVHLENWLEKRQHTGRDGISMKTETFMMDTSEIRPVIGHRRHVMTLLGLRHADRNLSQRS